MRQDYAGVVLSCANPIYWVQETDHVLVVDETHQKTYILSGVEGALWNWLVLAYPYNKVVDLLATLLGLSIPTAEVHMHTILRKWLDAGLLWSETY